MPQAKSLFSGFLFRDSRDKRRPAGVSRRQKHRRLQIETLESRQMMSATPVSYDYDLADVVMRDLLMDSQAIRSLTDASNLTQYSPAQLAAATQWVVFADLGTDLSTFAAEGGFSVTSATEIVPGSFVVTVGAGGSDGLIVALSGESAIDYFYPLVPFGIEAYSITNDPFLERQWHLVNYGQEVGNPNFGFEFGTVDEDINIEKAWDSYTGSGVIIAIVDSGVQLDHPDLMDNLREDLGLDLVDGGVVAPASFDNHGTAVAGLAAGVGNNGIGIAGVAYNAEIAPIRLFNESPVGSSAPTDLMVAQALLHQFQVIDVYNHSWGFGPVLNDQGVAENPRAIIDFGPLATLALRNSVFFGRGGLGSIHVFAAGNEAGIRDSGNNSGQVNSRYTIAVGGVIHDGTEAGVSEGGAAVLVVAPTGSNPETIIRDDELGSGITTTDRSGDLGYNEAAISQGLEIDADYLQDTDYTSRFNGTSASAPIVSGVIALMLEANPNLTYRDVQHILVRSARQNKPEDNSWITNINEFFADPLAVDSDSHKPRDDPQAAQDKIFDGTWPFPSMGGPSPSDEFVYYRELRTPHQFTNGAGFTVSQMTTNQEYTYGHGVVDAAMAVELARNWVTLGGQQSEFTFTTGLVAAPKILPAAISNEETGELRIPGGVNPNGDGSINEPNAFIDFLNEFAAEDDPAVPAMPTEDPDGPFSGDDPPINTRDFGAVAFGQNGIPIIGVPAMTVEWIELQIDIRGDENAMDFLRISIVSPDGTVSELKPYELPNADNGIHQDIFFEAITDPIGVLSPGGGGLQAVYTTNRHWGERTEGKPRLNSDGTPVRAINTTTPGDNDKLGDYDGEIIVDGWRLVFENFGEVELDIATYELAFHGIGVEGTGRIQGAVGVDDDGNRFYSDSSGSADNFTRYLETELFDPGMDLFDPDDDRDFRYFGDGSHQFVRGLNPDQESWAAGVIVYADLDSNGVRDATDPHYQVGADGNYFFDLPVGLTYDIRIDPTSLAAAGLENDLNIAAVAGVLAQAEIQFDGERVLATPVDNMGSTTISAFYGFNSGVTSSVPELNILLTPNAQPEEIVDISGIVYADLNENGVQDGNDVVIGGAVVFIDINQNGVFTPGVDPFRTTVGGHYSFEDLEATPGFYAVKVLAGTTGSFGVPVNPENASTAFFFAPGLERSDVHFGFTVNPDGGTGNGTVAISGVVFEDINETGTRQSFENGLMGSVATVYLDLNGDNMLDASDESVALAANGSFVFNSLNPGSYSVRIDFDEVQYRQTTPAGLLNPDGSRFDENDWEFQITLTAGSIQTGLEFGLKNNATADWGDLPAAYGATLLSQNGARHIVDGNLYLGAGVDNELNGFTGSETDDSNGTDDENGIVFSTLLDNSTSLTLDITAHTFGGWLQAWFDWNGDTVFDASERVYTDLLLPAGLSQHVVSVPTAELAELLDGVVYARLRYGEQGINDIHGEALRGEVEDYAITVVSTAPDPGFQLIHGPDFDEDGDIDGRDLLILQRNFGITSGALGTQGDANSDGRVDIEDLKMWRAEYGDDGNTSGAQVLNPDFDGDGDVDGRDFLAMQRHMGTTSGATLSDGDSNGDGKVNSVDQAVWQEVYGEGISSGNLSAVRTSDQSASNQVSGPVSLGYATSFGGSSRPALSVATTTAPSLAIDIEPTPSAAISSTQIEASAAESTFGELERRGVNSLSLGGSNLTGERRAHGGGLVHSRTEESHIDAAFGNAELIDLGTAPKENRGRHHSRHAGRFAPETIAVESLEAEEEAFATAFAEHGSWRQF